MSKRSKKHPLPNVEMPSKEADITNDKQPPVMQRRIGGRGGGSSPKSGAPPVIWTAEEKRRLGVLAGLGLPIKHIAPVFGLTFSGLETVLRTRPDVREAMDQGKARASEAVVKTAYRLAKSGRIFQMTMFWLKTQLGWRETDRVEHTGPNSGPIPLLYLPQKETQSSRMSVGAKSDNDASTRSTEEAAGDKAG